MIEKLFRLNSESSWELDELAHSFQEGPATVRKIDDFYWLILEFESDKADADALDAATTALTLMGGICLVRDNRFRSPTIAGIAERDLTTGKIGATRISFQLHAEITVRGRISPTLVGPDGTIQPRQATFEEQAFRIAKTNEPLSEALRTYDAVKHEWPGLYRVFETIKEATKGKVPGATPTEIKHFTQAANNFGDDPTSRHGYIPDQAKQPLITIAQGRELIQKVLEAWINELIAKEDHQSP